MADDPNRPPSFDDLPGVEATTADPATLDVDALVVPVLRGAIEAPGAEPLLLDLGLDGVPRDAGFRGDVGELQVVAAPGLPCGRVVLVGLGRMDRLDDEILRRAAGAATRALRDRATTLATTLPLVTPGRSAVRAVAEGAILGAWRYDALRTEPPARRLETVTLVVPSSLEEAVPDLLERATVHARAQCIARDLVATPPDRKAPATLAEQVPALVGDHVEVEVWDERRLADERCGGVLAVGRGSARPPRLLLLRYRPPRPAGTVALVGKGVVFDSGGISLKRPNELMVHMKSDMAGAAAVIGAFSALAALEVRFEVLGLCPLVENAIGGDAQRPSDVIRMRDGSTVEVLNTDAEGRLILADALCLAAEEHVEAIVDLATLTGAASHAVGGRATAAMGNDDELVADVLRAAEAAGEPTWRLPLWDDLRENLDSEVADRNNLGAGDAGGSIMGGLFLEPFVDDRPWVHLDIAPAAWAERARGHLPVGGTGSGVRTLLRWLE